MKKQKAKLRDVLELCDRCLPDTWISGYDDIRPDGAENVRLCFMAEQETHIETYVTHPLLIPWYDCEVESIGVDDDVLEIWLDFEPFWKKMIGKGEDYGQERGTTEDHV